MTIALIVIAAIIVLAVLYFILNATRSSPRATASTRPGAGSTCS